MDKKNNNSVAEFMAFSMNRVDNTPVFKETKADWIPYGSDNDYPTYLENLMNSSSKHNSLLTKKVGMTVGKGFEENPALVDFFANSEGKSELNEIVYKLGWDLYLYGGYSMSVTWSRDKTKISRISYMPFSKVRIAKEDEENEGMIKAIEDGKTFFMYSGDWKQYRKEKYKPEYIQSFDGTYYKEDTELIYYSEYRAGVDYYTHPSYISTIDWIELDREIANFHLSSVHNGFTPSMIISFNGGIPEKEKRIEVKKNLEKQYQGTDNASNVFVTFSDGGDSKPEFIPINLNASDDRFIQLEQQIQQNIIVGHGASPIVAGVSVAGKLGSSDEIEEAENAFYNSVIEPRQKAIEKTFNSILVTNGETEEVKLDSLRSIFEEEVVDSEVVDVEAESKANLRGSVGGVTGILSIAAQVTEGTISKLGAIAILETIFGISKENAAAMLQGDNEVKKIEDGNE
jgi:hypothetical protein